MTEEERRQAIQRRLSRIKEERERSPIPTGFPTLDEALGIGGLPRGSIVEIYGPEGCGKTSLLLQIIAFVQRHGGAAAFIDAEHAFNTIDAKTLGVDLERMPLARPGSAEEALAITSQLAASCALDLIVVDSAAALVPQIEREVGIGEAGPSAQSRLLAGPFRRLAHAVMKTDACVVFLNQSRYRPEVSGRDIETSASGFPLKLHAAVRIAVIPQETRIRLRVLKNKVGKPFREAPLSWKNGRGFVGGP
ncbi:MAG TPA: ATPase domain-containing protein [Bryobacteraceae bacterium]|nr:ATPase domain-containing protein [Bryobacteraceae bacterium]